MDSLTSSTFRSHLWPSVPRPCCRKMLLARVCGSPNPSKPCYCLGTTKEHLILPLYCADEEKEPTEAQPWQLLRLLTYRDSALPCPSCRPSKMRIAPRLQVSNEWPERVWGQLPVSGSGLRPLGFNLEPNLPENWSPNTLNTFPESRGAVLCAYQASAFCRETCLPWAVSR